MHSCARRLPKPRVRQRPKPERRKCRDLSKLSWVITCNRMCDGRRSRRKRASMRGLLSFLSGSESQTSGFEVCAACQAKSASRGKDKEKIFAALRLGPLWLSSLSLWAGETLTFPQLLRLHVAWWWMRVRKLQKRFAVSLTVGRMASTRATPRETCCATVEGSMACYWSLIPSSLLCRWLGLKLNPPVLSGRRPSRAAGG